MKVLVYSASWCRDCREAKRFLDKHQIAYTEVDIESTPGAAEEVMRHVGKRAIPQFVLDGKWVQPYRPGQGFLPREMSELVGVREETDPTSPSKGPGLFRMMRSPSSSRWLPCSCNPPS